MVGGAFPRVRVSLRFMATSAGRYRSASAICRDGWRKYNPNSPSQPAPAEVLLAGPSKGGPIMFRTGASISKPSVAQRLGKYVRVGEAFVFFGDDPADEEWRSWCPQDRGLRI